MDGKARSTKARSAKASLQFTGTAIAWVGPVGPSRGKARVYIDGRLVTTVNTWASTFRASRVLFTKSWAKVGTHRISIVANGTPGHPMVALDAFLVRRERVAQSPAPTPAPATSVRVTSVAALLDKLADDSVTEIVVANGTYRVSPASSKASNSLWIDVAVREPDQAGRRPGRDARRGDLRRRRHDRFRVYRIPRRRPRPDLGRVPVRQRPGDLDRRGDLRRGWWRAPGPGSVPDHDAQPHDDRPGPGGTTTRNTRSRRSTSAGTGPHDLLFEDITVDGRGYLASAFHFDHSDCHPPQRVERDRPPAHRHRHPAGDHPVGRPLRDIVFDYADITTRPMSRPLRAGSGIRLVQHRLDRLRLRDRLLQLAGQQPVRRHVRQQQLPLTVRAASIRVTIGRERRPAPDRRRRHAPSRSAPDRRRPTECQGRRWCRVAP